MLGELFPVTCCSCLGLEVQSIGAKRNLSSMYYRVGHENPVSFAWLEMS